MTSDLIELTEEEFEQQYRLRRNHLNPRALWGDHDSGSLFETHGEEFAFVCQQDPRTVWTLIDGDEGDLTLISGLHFVNRIGYLLTELPVPEGIDVQVQIPVADDDRSRYSDQEA